MKKLILLFSAILIGIALFFKVIDSKSEYVAEKTLYKINKEFSAVSTDPKSVPDATFTKIIDDYEKFIKRFSYSKTIPSARLFLARLYRVQENHVKSREALEKIIQEYKDDPIIAVQALVDIGLTYEAQNDIPSILKVYKRIQAEYPLTSLGINAPLLVAQLYSKENDLTSASQALDSAIVYYHELILKYPGSQVQATALKLLSTAYFGKRQWLNCTKALMKLLEDYPNANSPKEVESIVRTINSISVMQLKNYDFTIKFYEKFITEHPKHSFNEGFLKIIEKIKEYKAQDQSQQKQEPSPSNGNKN